MTILTSNFSSKENSRQIFVRQGNTVAIGPEAQGHRNLASADGVYAEDSLTKRRVMSDAGFITQENGHVVLENFWGASIRLAAIFHLADHQESAQIIANILNQEVVVKFKNEQEVFFPQNSTRETSTNPHAMKEQELSEKIAEAATVAQNGKWRAVFLTNAAGGKELWADLLQKKDPPVFVSERALTGGVMLEEGTRDRIAYSYVGEGHERVAVQSLITGNFIATGPMNSPCFLSFQNGEFRVAAQKSIYTVTPNDDVSGYSMEKEKNMISSLTPPPEIFIAKPDWEAAAYVPDGVPVRIITTENKGHGLVATQDLAEGQEIFEFVGKVYDVAEMGDRATELLEHALQVGEDKYLVSTDYHFDNFLNCSLTPNCWIRFSVDDQGQQKVVLVALRAIPAGEELFFNYNTTEWDMENPEKDNSAFTDAVTGKRVAGFKYLPREEQEELLPYVSPYIREKYEASLVS